MVDFVDIEIVLRHGMSKESHCCPLVLSGFPHPVWLQDSVHHGDGLRHHRQRQ